MRTAISSFFIITATLSISQTKTSDFTVTLDVDPVFNNVTVKLKTDSDSLSNCFVQIIDSKNNTVQSIALPKATKQTESSITILDLGEGNYTCLVYQGNDELYRQQFIKDAILMEPQTQPVIRNNPKK